MPPGQRALAVIGAGAILLLFGLPRRDVALMVGAVLAISACERWIFK
ncbi:MAG: hypothetical protein WBA98_03805 [Gordonia sp. (in: high G+C Gram-positive bacteria)]